MVSGNSAAAQREIFLGCFFAPLRDKKHYLALHHHIT
jgi:hypothetical protein